MNGVLPVDKPAGPTSHDVVAAARRSLGLRRIGHTGTLDPFATGLLLLCLGPATRLSEYLTGLDKRYEATVRLGTGTDTLDPTGAMTTEDEAWRGLSLEAVREAFRAELGTRLQQPPAFSAKKIGGRRAYDLARQGEAILPEPVEVTIHSIEVTAIELPEVRFNLTCSSGTYVRAVARDVGERLGTAAHLTALRRTRVGELDIDGAIGLEALDAPGAVESALLDPLRALRHLAVAEVDDAAVARIGNGQAVPAPEGLPSDSRLVAVAGAGAGGLVAVAERDGDLLRPRKVFT